MEAILKFNLPDEDDEFYQATNGRNYNLIIYDLFQEMRRIIKYDDNKSDVYIQAVEDLREKLCDLHREYGVKID